MARGKGKIRGYKPAPKTTDEGAFIEVLKMTANDPTLIRQQVQQKVNRNQKWVSYGILDNQFQYLLDLYVNSVTHNAITDSISHMIYGNGLNADDIIDPKDNKKVIKDFQIFGNAVLQVTANDIFHTPANYWRAAELEEGETEVTGYWFSTNFQDKQIEPQWFPAWTKTWKPSAEFPSAIYYVRTYTPNAFFYGLPNFQGGLSYMEQEIEVAKFLIHYIKNKFSVTTLINFNGGIGDPQSRSMQKREITTKLTGSEGDDLIVSFNKSKDSAATIEKIGIDNASEQYSYMTTNARQQIVVAHQVTSPLLVGIRDGSTGFSSNADELIEARALLEEMQIKPKQELLSDAYNDIKGRKDIAYISSAGDVAKEEVSVTEETAESVALKKVNPHLAAFLELGVTELEGYELVLSEPVHYDTDDEDDYRLSEEDDLELVKLASTGAAFPNAKSSQDINDVLVRYRYRGNRTGQRDFCNQMTGADKIYRKEDVIRMGGQGVNVGFGPNGARTYSIWLYKGGVNCYHQWFREIYVKKGVSVDVKSPLATTISTAKARRDGNRIETNNPLVAVKPINMPNQGALN